MQKVIVANSLDKLFDDACADEHKYLDPIPGKGMKTKVAENLHSRAPVTRIARNIYMTNNK